MPDLLDMSKFTPEQIANITSQLGDLSKLKYTGAPGEEIYPAKQAVDAMAKSAVTTALQFMEAKASPVEKALLQIVEKAIGNGATSSEIKIAIAGIAAPFINAAIASVAGRFGLSYQVTPDQLMWLEGLAISYVLGRSWVKSGLHKLAADLVKLGLDKAGAAVDAVAG